MTDPIRALSAGDGTGPGRILPLAMSEPRATTYWGLIQLDELLALQGGLERDEAALDNEEVLFITVHQIFELWFKLVLRELLSTRDLFTADRVEEQELSGVVAGLNRAITIFNVATKHFEVVETLGTREYLEFRNKLMPASGFQSAQLRRIEILLGLDEKDRIAFGAPGSHLNSLLDSDGSKSPSYAAVEGQLADRPTLKEAIETWLARTPIDGVPHDAPHADEHLKGYIGRYLDAHAREVDESRERALALADSEIAREQLRAMYDSESASVRDFLLPSAEQGGLQRARIRTAILFIETYRELPLLAWPREVLSSLIALEQAFLIFRQRHARMVERVIGRRTGTGGSAGVEYLDETARKYRIFRDLWATRTIMVRTEAAPKLEDSAFYGFTASS